MKGFGNILFRSYVREIPGFTVLGLLCAALTLYGAALQVGDKNLFHILYPRWPSDSLGRKTAELLTLLGGGVVAGGLLIWLTRRWIFLWLALALGWLTVGALTWCGKHLICPQCLRPSAFLAEEELPEKYPVRRGPGMPSGHSAEIALAALVFASALRDKRWSGMAAAGLAILVGLSRIWLAQHFPSQVAAGWLTGVFSFLFWDFLLFLWRYRRQCRFDVRLD